MLSGRYIFLLFAVNMGCIFNFPIYSTISDNSSEFEGFPVGLENTRKRDKLLPEALLMM